MKALLLVLALLFGCVSQPVQEPAQGPLQEVEVPPVEEDEQKEQTGQELPDEVPVPPSENETNTTELANPASVYCIENNGTLEMRTDELGTSGYCIFENGAECEEWAYFRGECSPSEETDAEFHQCPLERSEICTMEYNPVCGRSLEPTGTPYYKDYASPCMACSKDSNAIGYFYGTCESQGK